ncbi:hypothetical protein RISK_002849 [Rhodopirellula islandica]|uniref:Uncharacterized protein n=1 Tax=Rhodopirellula islandica TaxID=595434 RepID=A0A0J1BES1_RHOIS|nr:hypothetical protein RISK_002849 [Rhodopirellula islandica]
MHRPAHGEFLRRQKSFGSRVLAKRTPGDVILGYHEDPGQVA